MRLKGGGRRLVRRLLWACGGLVVAVACSSGATRGAAVAHAGFLVVSDDSTAWVHDDGDSTHVQRAPMVLAQLDGRLIELYVAEEAIEFENASFLAGRVYRRDLVTGDSTLLFADSTVLRAAMEFQQRNPTAQRLGPDDEPGNVSRSLIASITPLDVVGSTLGVDVHVDDSVGEREMHDTYRVTLDLRSGARLTLAAVLSPAVADSVMRGAARLRDSAIALAARQGGAVGQAAGAALAALPLDPRGFALGRVGDSLTVSFLTHAEQRIEDARDTHRYVLEPLAVPAPSWWADARRVLPRSSTDSVTGFSAESLSLDLRYDEQDVASIVARSGGAVVTTFRIRGPIRRLIPLRDSLVRPPDGWRRALQRAFSEAGYYSDEVRSASFRGHARNTTGPRCRGRRTVVTQAAS